MRISFGRLNFSILGNAERSAAWECKLGGVEIDQLEDFNS